MSLPLLRDDALSTTADGFELRVSLPWIRSVPLACVSDLAASIDGSVVEPLRVRIAGHGWTTDGLADADGWWFVQDRLVLTGGQPVDRVHTVAVSFRLLIPYLPGGPDAPLVLPFAVERRLEARPSASVSDICRDVA